MPNQRRVIMVDDDPFTRSNLASTLQVLGCFVVAADSVSSALRSMRNFAPDNMPNVALLDLDLGEGPTGLDLAQTLREEFPEIAIVVLSTYVDPRLIGSNLPEIPLGGVYVVKSSVTSQQVLGEAIDQAIANINLDKKKIAKPNFELSDLSDKQVEMMRMVASGLSNAEIAKRQWMTEAAVEKAITRLSKKMNLSGSKEQNQRVMIASTYHQLTGSVNVRSSS